MTLPNILTTILQIQKTNPIGIFQQSQLALENKDIYGRELTFLTPIHHNLPVPPIYPKKKRSIRPLLRPFKTL